MFAKHWGYVTGAWFRSILRATSGSISANRTCCSLLAGREWGRVADGIRRSAVMSNAGQKMRFRSADQFLAFIQTALADPLFVPPKVFRLGKRPSRARQAQWLLEGQESSTVAAMAYGLCKSVPGLFDSLSERAAFGTARLGAANAACFRSDEGYYAIVVNDGLRLLIINWMKLSMASLHPDAVVRSQFGDPRQLEAGHYYFYQRGMMYGYRVQGSTRPIELELNERARNTVASLAEVVDFFVVGHELGHLLNGDLDETAAFRPFSGRSDLESYVEWSVAQREYRADATAVDLIMDLPPLRGVPPLQLEMVLSGVGAAFSVLGQFEESVESGSSHPDATKRLKKVVEHVGPRATAYMDDARQSTVMPPEPVIPPLPPPAPPAIGGTRGSRRMRNQERP